jgi:pimeloyl-ACP methyl ester carboxylesterase
VTNRRTVLLVVLSALLVGCVNQQHRPAAATAAADLEDCGSQEGPSDSGGPRVPDGVYHHCLELELPLANGEAARVSIGVLSDRAEDPLEDRELIVYHPGGPGLATLPVLFGDAPGVDLARFSVLAWDGVTSSRGGQGACGEVSATFGTQRAMGEPATDATRVAAECVGPGRGSRGARAAADELEAVRRALGVESFHFLARSYGTAIAETYLLAYPQRVDRVVLDGPLALGVMWQDRIEALEGAVDRVLPLLLASCRPPSCGAGVAGVVGQPGGYDALRAELVDAAPTVGSSQLTLSPTIVDQATLLAMRDRSYWQPYFDAVGEALEGDASALWTLGERYYSGVDRGAFYASICVDIDHPDAVDGYESAAAPLMAMLSELAPCASSAWTPPTDPRPATQDAPDVLVLASPWDVVTPAALVAHADPGFGGSWYCETAVVGHTSSSDGEATAAMLRFLQEGVDPDRIEGCIAL